MTCPVCGGDTHILDSRPSEDSTKRRRECLECMYRFSTVEIDVDYYARLIKKGKAKNETEGCT
jgi:transcriptional regulator NrdR family protein